MTVNTTSITSGPYTGNGVTTSFPYTFKAFTDANVIVYQTVGGIQYTRTLGTHYSVTGTGVDGGGNVVMVTAPASGDEIYIRSNYSAEQLTDFDSQGGFYPDTHEDAFDKQTMLIQQLQDVQNRTLRISNSNSNTSLPPIELSPGQFVQVNATADGFQMADTPSYQTSDVAVVNTIADLAVTAAPVAGMVVDIKQHTSGGLGGGRFQDKVGTITNDGGTLINNSVTAGRHWKRIDTETLSIDDFGANPSSTTQTDAALTLIMASTHKYFYVPAALYTTTKEFFNLTKTFYGPGQITTASDSLPGNFTYVATKPVFPTGGGLPYDFQGDISKMNGKYYVLGSGVRTSLTDNYFQSQTTPNFTVFDNRAGNSGTLALTLNAPAAGTTVFQFSSTTGFFVGQVIGINDSNDNITDIRTVTEVSAGYVTVGAALSNSYPIGTRVTESKRTMCPADRIDVFHRGGGDAYAWLARVEVSKAPIASQSHIFFTSTGGIIGGDLNAGANGVFLTGSEIQHNDNGFDIGAVGSILNFNRSNATGARGAFWAGVLLKSEGTQPMNSGFAVGGKFNTGLDTVKADFGPTGIAVSLAADQKIGFDSSATDMAGYSVVGNVMATTYMQKKSSLSRMENYYEGTLSFVWNAAKLATTGYIEAGTHISVPLNGRVYLNGFGSTTYITYNGTNIQVVKAGGAPVNLA